LAGLASLPSGARTGGVPVAERARHALIASLDRSRRGLRLPRQCGDPHSRGKSTRHGRSSGSDPTDG
jgi:hypothetical protein